RPHMRTRICPKRKVRRVGGGLSAWPGKSLTLKRDGIWMEASSRFMLLFEHDLFGKPLHFSGSCSN
ncbi:hypothetical protein, partial [Stenotrophomonas maltophilia]|uniref:hypothetical protein n=1 Tax=Stenotrophomonas maltophilia TaxID=40324 RepID=UPI0019541E79